MPGWIRRLIQSWHARHEPLAIARLVLSADGLEAFVQRGGWEGSAFHVRWREVVEIVTWKDDLFTVDLINLGFRERGRGEFLAVSDETEGWGQLLQALGERFPGIPEDWYTRVMLPAFATNWATIWGEPSDPSNVILRRVHHCRREAPHTLSGLPTRHSPPTER